jgi:hypothetical protein
MLSSCFRIILSLKFENINSCDAKLYFYSQEEKKIKKGAKKRRGKKRNFDSTMSKPFKYSSLK